MSGRLEANECLAQLKHWVEGLGEDPGYAQESISNPIQSVSRSDLCFKDCAVAAQGTDWEK